MKPHIIADSAFASSDLMLKVKTWGGSLTTAVPSNNNSYLWKLLSWNVPPNFWRAAISSDGNLASIHRIIDDNSNKITTQQILSTGFNCVPLDFNTPENLISNITSIFKFCLLIFFDIKIPLYTQEYLISKTVLELNEICVNFNIKKGKYEFFNFQLILLVKGKQNIISKILHRVASEHRNESTILKVLEYVTTKFHDDPAPLHNFYKSSFNWVDLADRYWYKVNDAHGNHRWKSKMLFAILRFAMVDVWAASTLDKPENWITFRANLADEIVKF